MRLCPSLLLALLLAAPARAAVRGVALPSAPLRPSAGPAAIVPAAALPAASLAGTVIDHSLSPGPSPAAPEISAIGRNPAAPQAPAAAPAATPRAISQLSAAAPQAPQGPGGAQPGAPEPPDAGRVFDGSAARRDPDAVESPNAPAPAPPGREPPGPELRRLAAPYRTDRQLSRLEQAPRAPGETFTFAVIGDAEPGRFWLWRRLWNIPGIFARQLKAADAQPVDFVLQLGDMVSRGIVRNFLAFFRELTAAAPKKPYLTVIGNHDRRNPHGVSDSKLYRALFGRTDYWFERGGYRFVVLDSSAQRVTPEQLRWLDGALDTPLRTVVFTHVPPASIGAWTDFGRLKGVGGFKKGDDEFTRIVARRGVSRVYVGHIHALDAREHRGVTYVLTGGGGSPLYPTTAGDARHHWLVIEAGPAGLTETVHSLHAAPEPLAPPRRP